MTVLEVVVLGIYFVLPHALMFHPIQNKTIKTLIQHSFPISGFHIIYKLMRGNINHRKIIYFIELIEMSAIQNYLSLTMCSFWNNEDFLRYKRTYSTIINIFNSIFDFQTVKSYLFVSKIQNFQGCTFTSS